jgi:hypothetical protein
VIAWARGVDGELLVVCSKTVTMRIGIREQAALEDRIGRRLDS